MYHSLTTPSGFKGMPGFEISGAYNFKKWLGVEFGYQRHSGQQILNQTLQYLNYDNMGDFSTTITLKPVNPTQGGPQIPTTTTPFTLPANSHTEAVGFGTADLTRNTFLIGPKFTWRSNSRFTPFAHIQFGVSQYKRNNFKMNYSVNSEYSEFNVDDKGENFLVQKQIYVLKGALTKGEFSSLGFAMSVGGGVDWKMSKRLSIRLIQADYLPARHGFNYKYTDDFNSDISDTKYTTVQIVTYGTGLCSDLNVTCADYVQETTDRVKYTGTRNFSYSVPHQFMHNIKLSAGIVFGF
jgi:hypothetical protein